MPNEARAIIVATFMLMLWLPFPAAAQVGFPDDGNFVFQAPMNSLSGVMIFQDQNRELFRIKPLGNDEWDVVVNPDITLTEAAEGFWKIVHFIAGRRCVQPAAVQ